jgi:hypothetical protein
LLRKDLLKKDLLRKDLLRKDLLRKDLLRMDLLRKYLLRKDLFRIFSKGLPALVVVTMVRYKKIAQKRMHIFRDMFFGGIKGKKARTPPTGRYCLVPFKKIMCNAKMDFPGITGKLIFPLPGKIG